jgi:hypothetical protein
VIKSRKMTWSGHTVGLGRGEWGAYTVFVRETWGKETTCKI